MANKKLSGTDSLLLLLYLDNNKPIKGAVRLMKMMFLYEKEIVELLKKNGLDSVNPPEFFAYDYGPFSKDVYEQIELFKSIDFIEVVNIIAEEDMAEVDDFEECSFGDEFYLQNEVRKVDGKYYEYRIIDRGIDFVEEKIIGAGLVTDEQRNILEQFKKKITSMSPKQILRYTYTKYPKYTEKSLIKDEVF